MFDSEPKRLERETLGRISARVASTPASLDGVWLRGSRARTDQHLAGEIAALGLYFLEVLAETASDGRSKPVFDAMTPESAEAAAIFLAHALARLRSSATAATHAAQVACREHLAVNQTTEQLLDRLIGTGDEFDPRESYVPLSIGALEVAIGPEARDLPRLAPAGGSDENDNRRLWKTTWAAGNRMYFKLVDPDAYAEWMRMRSRR